VAQAFPSAPPGSDEEMSAVWLASRKSSVSSEARAHFLFGVAEGVATMSWLDLCPQSNGVGYTDSILGPLPLEIIS
jgi:hypothetical protein